MENDAGEEKYDRTADAEIKDFIEEHPGDKDSLIRFVKDNYSNTKLGSTSLGRIFEVVAGVDQDGNSREVSSDELKNIHKDFITINGSPWTRVGSNSSWLGKKYKISKTYNGKKVASVQLVGKIDRQRKQTIRQFIRKHFAGGRCVFCGSKSNIEIDHKDGTKEDDRVMGVSGQEVSDFQPTCKQCNDLKRNICNTCFDTNTRPDPRNIIPALKSLPVGWTSGGETLDKNRKDGKPPCAGCYFYDPIAFFEDLFK